MTDEKLLQEVRARAMGMGFNARWLILELANRYEMAQVEIKRLKEAYLAYEETTGIKKAKVEAIKEFADRLKNRTHEEAYSVFDSVDSVYDEDIDLVLAEMAGELFDQTGTEAYKGD